MLLGVSRTQAGSSPLARARPIAAQHAVFACQMPATAPLEAHNAFESLPVEGMALHGDEGDTLDMP